MPIPRPKSSIGMKSLCQTSPATSPAQGSNLPRYILLNCQLQKEGVGFENWRRELTSHLEEEAEGLCPFWPRVRPCAGC